MAARPSTPGVVMMRRPDQHGIAGPSLRIAARSARPARYATSSRSSRSELEGRARRDRRAQGPLSLLRSGQLHRGAHQRSRGASGETLFRFGVVTREATQKAIAASNTSGKTLRRDAIELDFVSPEERLPMMGRQVEEVFYAALHVADGMFYFFDKYDEAAIGRRHNLNAGMMLMEGDRRMGRDEVLPRAHPRNENYIPLPRERTKKCPPELVAILQRVRRQAIDRADRPAHRAARS